jgi:predicted transcriptional regulator
MERMIVYQMTPEDLRAFFEEEYAKKEANASRDELLKRFEGKFVGVNEVATLHGVSRQTVRNYVNDGLITPELRTIEGGKYMFRLSYVLTVDFEELKKRLRGRKGL